MTTKTKYIVKIAILSALATIVMYIESPIPFMPAFLKLDLSEIVVLLGGFSLGPVAGILIELVKNLVHITSSMTGGVGELANFIVGCAFVVPAAAIYKKNKSIKTALLGLAAGSVLMVIVATIVNYFVLIPLYIEIFAKEYNITADQSLKGIVDMGTKNNKSIVDLRTLVMYGIIPFNIVKTAIVSILTFISYKKVSPLLHK